MGEQTCRVPPGGESEQASEPASTAIHHHARGGHATCAGGPGPLALIDRSIPLDLARPCIGAPIVVHSSMGPRTHRLFLCLGAQANSNTAAAVAASSLLSSPLRRVFCLTPCVCLTETTHDVQARRARCVSVYTAQSVFPGRHLRTLRLAAPKNNPAASREWEAAE